MVVALPSRFWRFDFGASSAGFLCIRAVVNWFRGFFIKIFDIPIVFLPQLHQIFVLGYSVMDCHFRANIMTITIC